MSQRRLVALFRVTWRLLFKESERSGVFRHLVAALITEVTIMGMEILIVVWIFPRARGNCLQPGSICQSIWSKFAANS